MQIPSLKTVLSTFERTQKSQKPLVTRTFGAGLCLIAGLVALLLLYTAVSNFVGRKLTGKLLVSHCQLADPKSKKSIYDCYGRFTPSDTTKHVKLFTSHDPIVTKRLLKDGSTVSAYTILAPGVHDTGGARLYIDGATTSRATDTLSLCLLALVSAALSFVGFISFRPRRKAITYSDTK